jgi:TPP-dependent pyruvate/acetoin dehydrogenase alpha subunit
LRYSKLTDRMSDPGTTYRSRDEVQAVRSERDAIAGLKKYILEWGATDEASLKAIDKAAKEEVDVAVAEAKESPQPDLAEFWKDIYVSPHISCSHHKLINLVQGYRAPFHAWT